jgi:hypothetical protein
VPCCVSTSAYKMNDCSFHFRLTNSEDTFCRACTAVNSQTERNASDVRYRSTKIRKILKLLRKIEKQPDTGKTIIFSEFVKMLDIIARVLDEESIRYVRCEYLSCSSLILTFITRHFRRWFHERCPTSNIFGCNQGQSTSQSDPYINKSRQFW